MPKLKDYLDALQQRLTKEHRGFVDRLVKAFIVQSGMKIEPGRQIAPATDLSTQHHLFEQSVLADP